MKSLADVKDIIDKILAILLLARETNWHNALFEIRKRCDANADEEDVQIIVSDILGMYGGMGSFSDLILYQNGKLMINETSQLDELRRRLFEEAVKQKK